MALPAPKTRSAKAVSAITANARMTAKKSVAPRPITSAAPTNASPSRLSAANARKIRTVHSDISVATDSAMPANARSASTANRARHHATDTAIRAAVIAHAAMTLNAATICTATRIPLGEKSVILKNSSMPVATMTHNVSTVCSAKATNALRNAKSMRLVPEPNNANQAIARILKVSHADIMIFATANRHLIMAKSAK